LQSAQRNNLEGRQIPHRRGEARFSPTASAILSFFLCLSRFFNSAHYRIAGENAAAKREAEAKEEDRRARKRRRLQDYGAIHGRDMSVVTRENADTRPGWIVTPLGRIIRPMKMRPLRPLRPLARPDASVGKGVVKKKKKTKVEVERRAKRQKIDMLKHGSVHLKGVFVDVTIPDSGYAAHADEPSGSRLVDDHVPTTKADTRENDESDETVGYKTDSSEESEGEDDDDEEDDDDDDEANEDDEDEDDAEEDEENEDEEGDGGLSDEELSTTENKQSNDTTLTSTNKLKELFAPRDEEGPSSL
jgi:hypothetical protein